MRAHELEEPERMDKGLGIVAGPIFPPAAGPGSSSRPSESPVDGEPAAWRVNCVSTIMKR